MKKTFKNVFILLLVVTFVSGCGKKVEEPVQEEPPKQNNTATLEEANYTIAVNHFDMTGMVTTYNISVQTNYIGITYTNTFEHPEYADGPLPKTSGSFTVTDSFFTEPLAKVVKKWNAEREVDLSLDGVGSLMLSSLEKSQNRTDDLCVIEGSYYCDINEAVMDYNKDGKITVEENFAYFVHEIDPSMSLLDDNRGNTTEEVSGWKAKGLIPEKVASTSSPRFKTSEPVNEIVLNGVTYQLEVDTYKKLLDNGYVPSKELEKEITNSLQIYGNLKDYPDARIIINIHTADYRTSTPLEDCIIDSIDVSFKPGTAGKFYWKIKDFVVDENTKKSELYDYFGLQQNGTATVFLYTDKYLAELKCGSVYETHEYSNSFRVKVSTITSSYTLPEWDE